MGYRRKKYTPEDRAQREAADNAIKAAADEKLTDPTAVAGMVGKLVTITSPRLLRYSLRNVALLMNQTEERGITLTDVDTKKAWRLRGYRIRKGETSLRIVAPKGTEKAEGDDTGEQEPTEFITLDGDDQGDETEARTRFRMVPVYDICQMVEIEDFEGDPVEIEPVADPAGVVRANLTGQLERLGYTVATTDDEQAAPLVDDDAHAVTVSAAGAVEQLAQAVAELITRPADQRPRPIHAATGTAAAPRPATAPAPGIPLDLGEFGTGRAVVEIDHDNGRAYYRVTGPNVRGCLTVAFYEPAQSSEPHRVSVIYGYDNGRGGSWTHGNEGQKRAERPTVNAIKLVGQTNLTLAEAETVRWIYVGRMAAGRYRARSESAPKRTENRTHAVVRAILRHFAQLPELPELFARAAALAAPELQRTHDREARQLSERIAGLERERAEAEERRGYYASLAAGGEIEGAQLEMFPA